MRKQTFYLNGVDVFAKIEHLEQENKELKETNKFVVNQLDKRVNQLEELTKALEEIRGIIHKSDPDYMCNISKIIVSKIDEVISNE